jgi:hypothetical protein
MDNVEAELRIQHLTAALEAAEYYISRLERFRDGKPVYDLGEAESSYLRLIKEARS